MASQVEDRQGPEGLVMEVKKGDVEKTWKLDEEEDDWVAQAAFRCLSKI